MILRARGGRFGSQHCDKSSLDARLGHVSSRALKAKFYASVMGKSMEAESRVCVIARVYNSEAPDVRRGR